MQHNREMEDYDRIVENRRRNKAARVARRVNR